MSSVILAIAAIVVIGFIPQQQYVIENEGTPSATASYMGVKGLFWGDSHFPVTDIVIEEEYKGVPVTSIGSCALSDSEVETVYVPSSVKYIFDSAFYECDSLREVTFEEGTRLIVVESHAFFGCDNLSVFKTEESDTNILYAEKITDSMKQAIDETNRRRQKQDLYNKIHGITPKALNKKVIDIMELEVEGDEVTKNKDGIEVKVKPKVNMNDPKAIVDYMNLLREKMKDAAKSLKFEEAAKYRDEIKELDNILKSME